MKKQLYILLILVSALAGCKKSDGTHTSGTATISNLRYSEHSTYALHGFTFSKGTYVSTESVPGPDMVIDTLNGTTLILQANNLLPSFAKVGDYPSEDAAKQAFNELKSFANPQWVDFTGPILPNQVWVYRSGADTYSKFRIISTILEKRQNLGQQINYGECTFEWVYQPNGSLTFP
jgi:hypothetical protein